MGVSPLVSANADPRRETQAPALTLVVPCYNEQAALPASVGELLRLLTRLREARRIACESTVCLVDDGSSDDTWAVIRALAAQDGRCRGVRLTRNFGHQNALLAGLLSAPGDVLISLDADLQDDPAVIERMLEAHARGADVVLAARSDRSSDSRFKRVTARAYYKLLKALGVDIVEDHADYRLMSRRAVESLRDYPEVNLFLRALVPQLGYRQEVVHYTRRARVAGESKYGLRAMLALAIDGVTAFSAAPLRLIALAGVIVFAGSVAIAIWALWLRFFTASAVPGWTSSVVPLYLLGGIQLLSVAVVGEYVAKLYLEAKGRPRYLLRETLGLSEAAGQATPATPAPRRVSRPPAP